MDLKQTNIIYLALLAGQVLLAVVIYLLLIDPEKGVQDGRLYQWLVPLVIVGVVVAARAFDNWYLNQAKPSQDQQYKERHYVGRVIMRLAIVEGGNLLALMVAIITNNPLYILFCGMGLGVFYFFRPKASEFEEQYLR